MKATAALVVDGNRARRRRLVAELGRRVGLAEGAGSLRRAEGLIKRCRFDCLILDLEVGKGAVPEWIADLKQRSGAIPVVLICDADQAKQAIATLRYGVTEVMLRPFEPASMFAAIQRAGREVIRTTAIPAVPRGVRRGTGSDAMLVGASDAMALVRNFVERAAPMPTPVLIEGEPGTGKELVARLLHQESGRRGSCVALNCGAVGPEALESELFGHLKGTSTEVHHVKDGLFVAARGGTLLLEEISEIPSGVAAKLLRALEKSAIRPVGSDRDLHVDVRVVASTRKSLAQQVRRGRFREDLYYCLNVMKVRMPPLRERTGDIEDLARFFMDTLSSELGLAPISLSRDQISRLREYEWPGNVRELSKFIEKTLLLGEFPTEPLIAGEMPLSDSFGYPEDWSLERVKTDHMRRVLEACDGNRSKAARRLNVSRKTLERKLGPRTGSNG